MQIKVKKFQKRKEDFVCEKCGTFVKGTGYTNHCPNCLWSKHVDIFPGDRLEDCGGMMEPVDVEVKKGNNFVIVHKCTKCGEISRVRADIKDNSDVLFEVAKRAAERKFKQLTE